MIIHTYFSSTHKVAYFFFQQPWLPFYVLCFLLDYRYAIPKGKLSIIICPYLGSTQSIIFPLPTTVCVCVPCFLLDSHSMPYRSPKGCFFTTIRPYLGSTQSNIISSSNDLDCPLLSVSLSLIITLHHSLTKYRKVSPSTAVAVLSFVSHFLILTRRIDSSLAGPESHPSLSPNCSVRNHGVLFYHLPTALRFLLSSGSRLLPYTPALPLK